MARWRSRSGFADRFAAKGWRLEVLDIAEGGKPNALNLADAQAVGDMRVYLDADVVMSPPLLEQLAQVLTRDDPAYASGKMVVAPAESWITRAYGRIWTRLPFMAEGVPGAGLFAVNAAGRARWGEFPPIISDDTFVRLQFTPGERIGVEAPYSWPLPEGDRRWCACGGGRTRGCANWRTAIPASWNGRARRR